MADAAPLKHLHYNGPAYGWALIVTTLLTVIFVAHHPMADMHDRAQGLHNIAAIADPQRWVHGGLMGLMVLYTVCFSGFAWRLGVGQPLVMAGWLSYVLGCGVMLLAALTDGFLVSDVAGSGLTGAYDLIGFCFILIQGFSKLGFVLIAAAIVLWGHALMHHTGGARWVGLLAMATGGFSAAFILTSTHGLNVMTLFWYMVAQTVWNMTVAIWMIRGLKRPEGL